MVRVIRKPGDSMIFNAKADITIDVDDIMVVVGATKDIKQLERVLQ
jgi:Trk K+ transport system NAD-binding subunit